MRWLLRASDVLAEQIVIRIWPAFACNNSSSFRLIARFAEATTATETAAELAEYFDAQASRRSYRYEDAALSVLARTYGFDWQDRGAGESGPQVVAEGDVLIVYQAYGLGLGPGVPAYLADRGATRVENESRSDVRISVLFRAAAGVDPRLDEELATVFAQPLDADRNATPLKGPWVRHGAYGRVAFFRDRGTVGMWIPIVPDDIARFKTWLAEHGIADAVIRIGEYDDEDLFLALARARCTACAGLLEYLDPRLHDIETPQLACAPCGGLYELSTFL
jgi:hypothetical protein